jgi:branched-chain amino acid transport system ATP-binding protein
MPISAPRWSLSEPTKSAQANPGPLLEVRDLHVSYGEVAALVDVNMEVRAGEIVALIGPNGAGKTTFMNTLSGLLRPLAGSISFDGRELAGAKAEEIVRSGISQVPEGRRVFGNLDVEENLLVGAHLVRDKAIVRGRLDEVFELFPRLRERRGQTAGTMSGGEQQMLAIGRAVMSGPRLLLLDEPSLGLAPKVVSEVFKALSRIVADGTTLLLVEQNSRLALRFAARAYVLETGSIVLDGDTDVLARDERVRRIYLGQSLDEQVVSGVGVKQAAKTQLRTRSEGAH